MSNKKINLYLYLTVLGMLFSILLGCGSQIDWNKNYDEPKVVAEIQKIEYDKPMSVIEETEEEPEYLKRLRLLNLIQDKKTYYITYKQLEEKYPEIAEIDHIYDCFDEEEIYYLQRCVETECFGAEFEGKVNVATVVINRVLSDIYPDTIKEVVTQPSQFTYSVVSISEDTVLACEYAWDFRTETHDCLYFHSGIKTNTFCGRDWKYYDGYHHFY